MADIANAMEIPEWTLRTIKKQAEKIKASCKSATRMMASKIIQIRVPIMERKECQLSGLHRNTNVPFCYPP
jgi:hypothetical protein